MRLDVAARIRARLSLRKHSTAPSSGPSRGQPRGYLENPSPSSSSSLQRRQQLQQENEEEQQRASYTLAAVSDATARSRPGEAAVSLRRAATEPHPPSDSRGLREGASGAEQAPQHLDQRDETRLQQRQDTCTDASPSPDLVLRLRPKLSHSPLLTGSALHSIHEDSAPTSGITDASDHDHLSTGHDPENLTLALPQTPAVASTGVAASALLSPPPPPPPKQQQQQQQQQQLTPGGSHPSQTLRPQILISNVHSPPTNSLLHLPQPTDGGPSRPAAGGTHSSGPVHVAPVDAAAAMGARKIWVKRPGASATLVPISDDDLVDDVRDLILRKYANSLGRTLDAPDLSIRIHPRDHQRDRILGPEEHMCRILDTCFPGGQTVDEALVIDIPRRTPKASPRAPQPHHTTYYYTTDDGRPSEAGEGYFPPVGGVPSPHLPLALPTAPNNGAVPHSIAVLGTGHIPTIPSPGGTRPRTYRDRPDRPRPVRTHTSSPNAIAMVPSATTAAAAPHGMPHSLSRKPPHSRTHSTSSDQPGLAPNGGTLSVSPAPEQGPARVATPPPRISSPHASSGRVKKIKKHNVIDQQSPSTGIMNGCVPPISVLIVEDNPINLKLLEAFVKRLKVRWKTAMNGRDAVKKWRTGGFHLVLMDIQLPVMNGLDATREIRRLERLNSVGVLSSPGSLPEETNGQLADQDRLENTSLFKSPVIIVALTASSLQSDRHEALAAGCNDFLTKPVSFVYLERKVMEWGCMQALIDFDGWRKWKDFSNDAEHNDVAMKMLPKAKSKKNRSSTPSS